ncbi:MAG: helix-turn-helix domain-containing protein [Rhizobiales bacterium]|nr:helix-turn-helix domain-containing protein [Hyphomicrobiales bacterium]
MPAKAKSARRPRTSSRPAEPSAFTARRPRAFLQGFANGLNVIRSFGPQTSAMTLSEVAKLNGLTRAAARRILLTMQELGYVEAHGRTFQLRPKVLDLGYAYLSSISWIGIAQPIVEDIVAKTRMPCNGSVLDNQDIIYVLRVSTRVEIRADLAISIGRRFPAYLTAMGRTLLSGLPPQDFEDYLASATIAPLTRRTVSNPAALRKVIASDRAQGWSFVNQEHATGICSIGVPLRDARARTFAALGIGWVVTDESPEKTRDRVLPVLLAAATAINRLLRVHGSVSGP